MYKTAREYLRLPICKEIIEPYKSTINRGMENVKQIAIDDLSNNTISVNKSKITMKTDTKFVYNLELLFICRS